jgi:DNA-binding LytR/AlgR family response regulator
MYTCFAIDDEFSALELLSDYIALTPELKLLKTFSNPLIALAEILKLKRPVDIVFLDIEMQEMNGIELASLIKHKTNKFVFTTGFANYAVDSYELEADGFLLKPISPVKFFQTVKRLFPVYEIHNKRDYNDMLIVKSPEQRNRLLNIRVADIIAVEAQERATKIYTTKEIIHSRSTLSEVLSLLSHKRGFFQIHRSFIIAESHIRTLERSYLILSNELRIPIGRKYTGFYYAKANK